MRCRFLRQKQLEAQEHDTVSSRSRRTLCAADYGVAGTAEMAVWQSGESQLPIIVGLFPDGPDQSIGEKPASLKGTAP